MKVIVSGAGGFLGGHLVKRLIEDGHDVRGMDIKGRDRWWQRFEPESKVLSYCDLADAGSCLMAADWVFHLACNMGGRGWIDAEESACAMNAIIDLNVLNACAKWGVKRVFYASTACIYPVQLQGRLQPQSLCEAMGDRPWNPDGMYGLAKLYGEQACLAFAKDHGMDIRIGRFHGVYGAHGSWNDGREKAPAAVCRKIAEAKRDGRSEIELWGSLPSWRSFMHVDDAVEGMIRIMSHPENPGPLNLGMDGMDSIDGIAYRVAEIAGLDGLKIKRVPGPVGVAMRNSDNTKIQAVLGWRPSIEHGDGLAKTYPWIEQQVMESRPSQL